MHKHNTIPILTNNSYTQEEKKTSTGISLKTNLFQHEKNMQFKRQITIVEKKDYVSLLLIKSNSVY